tara:strand:- start:691 stop:1227 length:537 start_codon:yes stop_codon:yes gene_type:complete
MKNFFDNGLNYWQVAETVRDLYMSEGTIATLLDYERVLDEMDLYAFKNWSAGELVDGPDIGRYAVTCTWLWPAEMMPDPRGAKRLLPFGAKIKFKKTKMKVPVKIMSPNDYRDSGKKPKIIEKDIWLVQMELPKYLINEIRSGSKELEDQDIDMSDLDSAYEKDLDLDQYQEQSNEEA